MSDRRRIARTQGKFSDSNESHPGRREKQSDKKIMHSKSSSENTGDNLKSQVSKSKAAEGINLEYQVDSKYCFEELSEKKGFQEIREKGIQELSTTENGTSRVIYAPDFLNKTKAEELYVILRDSTKWHDKNIIIRGQEYPQPRLVAWYGPFPYSYSGATLDPAAMPSCVVEIKQKIETFLKEHDLNVTLNSVLLNLYRNGKDSVAWHSDDELTMGVKPTIASISLGEIRAFQMRPKAHVKNIDPESRFVVNLLPGSLLIMDGCMQKDWQHQVPKEYHDKGPRINLTFRTVYPNEKVPIEVPCSKPDPVKPNNSTKTIQPNPVYDSENFPPLISANDAKSNAPNETNSSQQNSSSVQKDTPANSKIADESESTTGSNKNGNFCLSKGDADSPLLCDSAMNNFPVTKESSNPIVAPFSKLVNNTNSEDNAREKSDVTENLGPGDGIVNSGTDNLQEYDVDNKEMNEAGCTGRNAHKFNVNAPDFVPTSRYAKSVYKTFIGCNLKELSDFFSSSEDESCVSDDFVRVLVEELRYTQSNNRDYFTMRDWFELEVYIRLMEGGESAENQKVINERIFFLVKERCAQYKYYPNRKNVPQRTRGRNNYRGISHRY